MQQPANSNQPTIPQHVVDQLENEWRQVRPEQQAPRPAQQQPQR
ncbi:MULTISPECIES: hypothetical protein [unclassified Rhizobium]|nr:MULTISPECIES: hypothetical protein [unclassified Rhizobium]MBB3314424.1 hypothetical protein [Rhizobium sp. BK181]MBB3539760.1 hypothetical protein [Rhizobium sp. BK399]MCS3739231.1 hypothetical protein [Rhizobium sp. BK661]MCS4090444.1 hypothetical protein [Rhizobium sp. BK176]